MASRWQGRDQRRAPRIDVMMRVTGQVTALEVPILVHDLSRTGFAVLSRAAFQSGQTLDFRLAGDDGATVVVTARAVHSRQLQQTPPVHLSGFMFVPGPLTGVVPQVLIDRLIDAVTVPALQVL